MAVAVILFLFGTAFGSFLNVVALRYNPERSVFSLAPIGGRSHCVSCGRDLRWFELIPLVSFLIQRAKCRRCGESISVRYFIVELLSGIIVAGVPYVIAKFYNFIPYHSFLSLEVWMYLLLVIWEIVFLTLLLIVLIDLDKFIIPDELNVVVGVLGIAIGFVVGTHGSDLPFASWSFVKQYALLATPTLPVLINRCIGAISGSLAFWVLYAASRGRGMGFGDVKLAAALGFLVGWPDIGLATALAFIVGGVWGLMVVSFGRGRLRDRVPFAPFFVIGTTIAIFWGNAIVSIYFSMFRG